MMSPEKTVRSERSFSFGWQVGAFLLVLVGPLAGYAVLQSGMGWGAHLSSALVFAGVGICLWKA